MIVPGLGKFSYPPCYSNFLMAISNESSDFALPGRST